MRVLIRYDVPGWAYHRRAQGYEKYHPEGWTVKAAPNDKPRDDERWDAVVMMDAQGDARPYEKAKIVWHIGSHAWMYERDDSNWRTRGVNENRRWKRAAHVVKQGYSVIVHNKAQRDSFLNHHRKVILAPYCPDPEIFNPRGRQPNDKLRVGWCQQVSGGLNSFKGLSEVLIPVVADVGNAVEWSVLTPDAKSCLTTKQLVNWYRSLDVFLCTSMAEGGPQGPFEASACGAAVLSTNVGQVADWDIIGKVWDYGNENEALEVETYFTNMLLKLTPGSASELAAEQYAVLKCDFNIAIEYPKQLEAACS